MSRLMIAVAGAAFSFSCSAAVHAAPVFDPSALASPVVLDYANSPAGAIAPGEAVLDQYAALGVRHDGHTTTPPGPPGISSLSGLPALEAGSGDLPGRFLDIEFDVDVFGIGAFYLMGGDRDSIILSVFDHAQGLLETVTLMPQDMAMTPGPFGFNEGFVGIVSDVPIRSARFEAQQLAFVVDDLHVVIPEPATIFLVTLGGAVLMLSRPRGWRGRCVRTG